MTGSSPHGESAVPVQDDTVWNESISKYTNSLQMVKDKNKRNSVQKYLDAIQNELGAADDVTALHRLAVEAVDERKGKMKWQKRFGVSVVAAIFAIVIMFVVNYGAIEIAKETKVDSSNKLVMPGSSEAVKTSSADFTVLQYDKAATSERRMLKSSDAPGASVLKAGPDGKQDLYVKTTPRTIKNIELKLPDGTDSNSSSTGRRLSSITGSVLPVGVHEFCVPCVEVENAVAEFAELGKSDFSATITLGTESLGYRLNVDGFTGSSVSVSASNYPIKATIDSTDTDADGNCCGTFFSNDLFHEPSSDGLEAPFETGRRLSAGATETESRRVCFEQVVWNTYKLARPSDLQSTGFGMYYDLDEASGCKMPDDISRHDNYMEKEKLDELLGAGSYDPEGQGFVLGLGWRAAIPAYYPPPDYNYPTCAHFDGGYVTEQTLDTMDYSWWQNAYFKKYKKTPVLTRVHYNVSDAAGFDRGPPYYQCVIWYPHYQFYKRWEMEYVKIRRAVLSCQREAGFTPESDRNVMAHWPTFNEYEMMGCAFFRKSWTHPCVRRENVWYDTQKNAWAYLNSGDHTATGSQADQGNRGRGGAGTLGAGHSYKSNFRDNCVVDFADDCFPATARVRTADGTTKTFEELESSDRVQTTDSQEHGYERVLMDFHGTMGAKQATIVAVFLEITHEASAPLRISRNHFLYAFRGGEPTLVLAESVVVGDTLLITTAAGFAPSRVSRIRLVKDRGIYAPLTFSGRLIVDDALVSSYAASSSIMATAWHLHPSWPWEKMFAVGSVPFRYFYGYNLNSVFSRVMPDWCTWFLAVALCDPQARTSPATAAWSNMFDALFRRLIVHTQPDRLEAPMGMPKLD